MWKPVSVFFVSTLFWSFVLSDNCTTPLGIRSNCISLYNCPELLAGFKYKPMPDNIATYIRNSHCGTKDNVPYVCCGPLSPEDETQRSTVREIPYPYTQQSTPRPRVPESSGGSDGYFPEDASPAPGNQCGFDTNGDKILGGEATDLDEFPWMALLGYRTPAGKTTYQCGGALINHRYVLTAAHCIKGQIEHVVGTLITVRLGEYDTQQDIDCLYNVCADPPQEIPVAAAYAHPGYIDRSKNRSDDIGIVRLARRATYTYYVQPICLVNMNEPMVVGKEVHVAGWGKTLKGTYSNVKLKLKMPIFSKDDCVSKYFPLGASLGENQLCAGGNFAQDTCRGDSGGPLMKKRSNGFWEAVGIVSFGVGCGRDGWPGVYTTVAGYLDWINSTLQSSNH